jgi:hypothetical protein
MVMSTAVRSVHAAKRVTQRAMMRRWRPHGLILLYHRVPMSRPRERSAGALWGMHADDLAPT